MNIKWAIAGSISNELLAWDGLAQNNHGACFILLTIFWTLWKERNSRAFEDREDTFVNIKNKWLHSFDSILLGHNLHTFNDIREIVDTLIDM